MSGLECLTRGCISPPVLRSRDHQISNRKGKRGNGVPVRQQVEYVCEGLNGSLLGDPFQDADKDILCTTET